jgi:hypothetical protein
MGYYMRVLTPQEPPVALAILAEAAARFGCRIIGDTQSEEWGAIEVLNGSGESVCTVERFPVEKGSIGEGEIEGFQEEIADCLPKSAVEWLDAYLPGVRTVYIVQVFAKVGSGDDWAAVSEVHEAIRKATGGIFQADYEGLSNEDGDHILWQFSDRVEGDLWAAVLRGGKWESFKMDLGNEAHRIAFKSGEVPAGAERMG